VAAGCRHISAGLFTAARIATRASRVFGEATRPLHALPVFSSPRVLSAVEEQVIASATLLHSGAGDCGALNSVAIKAAISAQGGGSDAQSLTTRLAMHLAF